MDVDTAMFNFAFVLLLIIIIVGTITNGLVILVFFRHKSLWHEPFHLLLLNMAVGAPLSLVAAYQRRWSFSFAVCSAYAMSMHLTGVVSISTIAAISVIRLQMVRSVGWWQHARHEHHLLIQCRTSYTVWLYGTLVTIPPSLGWGEYGIEGKGISCCVNWYAPNNWNLLSYSCFDFLAAFLLPFAVTIWSYARLKAFVWKIIAMLGCFIFSWGPYAIASLTTVLGYEHLLSDWMQTMPALFAKSSLLCNPFVYYFTVRPIRNAIGYEMRRFLTTPGRATNFLLLHPLVLDPVPSIKLPQPTEISRTLISEHPPLTPAKSVVYDGDASTQRELKSRSVQKL